MSHESTLNHIHSTINQKLADVESRIERVKTAKKEIEKEHETGIVEIRQILHPHLNNHWTGDFANDFDDERDEARAAAKEADHLLSLGEKAVDQLSDKLRSIKNSWSWF